MFKKKFFNFLLAFSTISNLYAVDKDYEISLKDENSNQQKIFSFRKKLLEEIEKYNLIKNDKEIIGSSSGKDVVVLLGNTGSGKSTILNLLSDKSLLPSSLGYELKDKNDPQAFPIGTGGSSETLLPKFAQIEGFTFYDLAGFGENRNEALAFMNAVFIKDILINAKSVSFLFVSGYGEILENRADSFKKLMDRVNKLLNNSSFLKDSSAIMLTKYTGLADKKKAIDIIKTKIVKNSVEEDFYKTFAIFNFQNDNPNLFMFKDASKFMDDDTGNFDLIKSDKALENTKEDLIKGLKNLRSVKISDVNLDSILDQNAKSVAIGLIDLISEQIFSSKLKIDINSLSIIELKNLNQKIMDFSFEKLDEEIFSKPEAKFIKSFDEKMYKKVLQKNYENFEQKAIPVIKDIHFKIKQDISDLISKTNKNLFQKMEKIKEINDLKEMKVMKDYFNCDKEIFEKLLFSTFEDSFIKNFDKDFYWQKIDEQYEIFFSKLSILKKDIDFKFKEMFSENLSKTSQQIYEGLYENLLSTEDLKKLVNLRLFLNSYNIESFEKKVLSLIGQDVFKDFDKDFYKTKLNDQFKIFFDKCELLKNNIDLKIRNEFSIRSTNLTEKIYKNIHENFITIEGIQNLKDFKEKLSTYNLKTFEEKFLSAIELDSFEIIDKNLYQDKIEEQFKTFSDRLNLLQKDLDDKINKASNSSLSYFPSSYSSSSYFGGSDDYVKVKSYYRKDGTYVRGYTRRK